MPKKNNRIAHFFVSIIVPIHNDSDIIEKFFHELYDIVIKTYENYEIVFVDDGSTDGTSDIISKFLRKYECLRHVRLSRSFGVETAISAGLDTVIGDAIVIIQPETDPPNLIPLMVKEIRKNSGVVYGIQRNKDKYSSWTYRAGKWVFNKIISRFLEYHPPENAGYFIALSRQTLNAVISMKDKAKFVRIFSSRVGFNRKEIAYDIKPRRRKMHRRSLMESIKYGIDAITTNTTTPLRFVTYLGFFAAFINILYMGYIFIVALFERNVMEGWITTSFQNSFMFFLLFIILTVIAEYLSRLIEETKNHPAYYIMDEKSSSVMISKQFIRRNILRDSEK
jgi:polyisoprenyl-phosphate glycosyltransferase